jgi:diaminohydroxyphosphoribosylaminopyrimidine deaminase/5-amino-6-(5-phosphoribosylamino)uracil reductase
VIQSSFSETDQKWMLLALELAAKGRYSTTPNPRVGAVIVDETGQLVGEGYHQKSGEAHAEVFALRQAKNNAKNATCYVTLEPCSHTGKTPPCADALIAARVKKVIIASVDANPLVNHNGIAKLKQAGITVETGLLKDQADDLNRAFFHRMRHAVPWVTVKLASSLDGKTALANGVSKWITGEKARADVQDLRAQSCAILSGADTVLADNPQLNVRPSLLSKEAKTAFAYRQKQPLRVLVDSKNRLSDDYQVFQDEHPVLVFNHQFNSKLSQKNTQQIQVKLNADNTHLCLKSIFIELANIEINSLWVEAGASLTGALFDNALVNELVLYQAPKILGKDARSLTNTKLLTDLTDAIDLKIVDCVQIGDDTRQRFLIKPSSARA